MFPDQEVGVEGGSRGQQQSEAEYVPVMDSPVEFLSLERLSGGLVLRWVCEKGGANWWPEGAGETARARLEFNFPNQLKLAPSTPLSPLVAYTPSHYVANCSCYLPLQWH